MKKKLTTVDFHGTAEQEQQLLAVIEKYNGVKGAMMPILQEAQEIYGYLPIEVQRIIAAKTGTPLEEIYGVASFYAQFKFNPNGEVAVAVCLGTACYVKGGAAVLAEVEKELGITSNETTADGKFTIQDTRCLGCCGLAPVMTINEDVYGKLTPDMIKDILAKY